MYGYFPVSNDRNDGATTRKKRQPLLIEHRESRYAILGYEIRYIYLLRESGTKERSFDSNRLSWNSIGLRFSSHERLSSECSAPLCHWYSGRRKLTRSLSCSIHAFRRGCTQNKDLDWPRSLSPAWNNNAVLSSIRITRDRSWIRRAWGEESRGKMFLLFFKFDHRVSNSIEWFLRIGVKILRPLSTRCFNDFETFFEITKIYPFEWFEWSWNFSFLIWIVKEDKKFRR